jgi:endonuclease YncB( thermonuclease family)
LRGLLFAAFLLMGFGSTVKGAESVRVIDGDTLAIDDARYRLHGIDAPEAGQRCNDATGGSWRCGDEATAYLLALVDSGSLNCDGRGQDDYGRILVVCRVDGRDLSEEMVADGYAWAFRKYSEDYADIEDLARANGAGIWRASTQTPWEFREARWAIAVQEAPEGCPIKGNISNNGYIYHAPWSPWYDRTKVSTANGERWFCSELEALEAGWRAPIWGR